MSVLIIDREDRGAEVGSDFSTTFTHVIQYEAENLMEIMSSRLLPQRGSRHPQNTAYFLDTIQVQPNGNKGRKIQALATLTYTNSTEMTRYFSGDPWDLGAQNFTSNYQTISKPFLEGYDKDGKKIQNLNSANCRILAETSGTIREITFTYCTKVRINKDVVTNQNPIINKKTEKVAGIDIPKMTGLLLPISAVYIAEYGAEEELEREYWELTATIQINPEGWDKKELNVGTMCYFKNSEGAIVKVPQNIYSYTPWKSVDPELKMKTEKKFGNIDDVIKAKDEYAKIYVEYKKQQQGADITEKDEEGYRVNAWNDLPFEEVTEPMPLRDDGTLYEEALSDPVTYPYKIKSIYEYVIGSWNEFDLPDKRA